MLTMQDPIQNPPGTLYVIATPIGNLRDITLRALETLRAVSLIAAEDTRVTSRLLAHHSLRGKLISLHRHNEATVAKKIDRTLSQGLSVALVTDAGTPAISDPGALLVKHLRELGYNIVPIPGPNAAICALSVAGLVVPHFMFYGFLPATQGARRNELQKCASFPYSLVFYEAPHRILDCITDMRDVLGPSREITIARELTKLFENIHVCPLPDAISWLEADPNRQKGEFVLILTGHEALNEGQLSDQAKHTLSTLLGELPLAQAVRMAAEITGESKNLIYARALSLKSRLTEKKNR